VETESRWESVMYIRGKKYPTYIR